RSRAVRLRRHAGNPDAGALTYTSFIQCETGRDSDNCKAGSGMVHLGVSLSGAAFSFVDANFAQDLAGLQCGSQEIDKEIVRLDRTLAILVRGYQLGIERDDRRGPVTGWIRMRDAAPDGSLVSDLYVAD